MGVVVWSTEAVTTTSLLSGVAGASVVEDSAAGEKDGMGNLLASGDD